MGKQSQEQEEQSPSSSDAAPRPYLAPGRLDVPVSRGTPTKAASNPSAEARTGSLSMEQIPTGRATNSALGGTLKLEPQRRGAPLHGAVGGRRGPWHRAAAAGDASSRGAASRSLILPLQLPATLCLTHGTVTEPSPILAQLSRLGQEPSGWAPSPSWGSKCSRRGCTAPRLPTNLFLTLPKRSRAASSFASRKDGGVGGLARLGNGKRAGECHVDENETGKSELWKIAGAQEANKQQK